MRRLAVLIPLGIFAILAGIFFVRLYSGDPSVVPSALLDKPVPQVTLAPLDGASAQPLTLEALHGQVTVVNFWASWCAPCRLEHPLLTRLSRDKRIQIAGINYKDKTPAALRFLQEHGNPFARIGVDGDGRAAIEWGVYGVPETFIVGRDGKIRYKQVGPLTPENFPRFLAEIEKALAAR